MHFATLAVWTYPTPPRTTVKAMTPHEARELSHTPCYPRARKGETTYFIGGSRSRPARSRRGGAPRRRSRSWSSMKFAPILCPTPP